MSATTLLINDVFKHNENTYRLAHVDQKTDSAYVIPLDSPTPDPRYWKYTKLVELAANPKKLTVVDAPIAEERPNEPSASDLLVRSRRWTSIQGIVKSPEIWAADQRPRLLRQHAKSAKTSAKTLLKNLRMWWAGGQTEEALMGSYFRSGRIEESTTGALTVEDKTPNGPVTVIFAPGINKARGRRPKDEDYAPLALSADLRKTILDVARTHYEEDACKSVRGATTLVLSELFSLKDSSGKPLRDTDGGAVLKPPGQRPSIHQIRYLLGRALAASIAHKRRFGAADYDNNHAPATGSVLDDCLGPGDVYEIDATYIDVYIVAKANRKVIIGKPVLFLVIDRWSRLIVGFYITLENPSWNEATQAILSISGDWEALCNRLNVTYDAKDWPARGVMPNRFVSDRADMITYASNSLCDGVATQVTNAPALASRDKALVESGFLSTHVPLRESAPGYEPPKNPFKRRAKKYHKDASMTLDEMAATYLRIVIAHNRMEKAGYQASPEEILGKLPCTPKAIWPRQMAERMGSAARMPIDLLRRKLMPHGVGQVMNDGLHFKGCIYKAHELGEWFTRASLKGIFDVTVTYTPNLVDEVLVRDPFDNRKQHTFTLTTTSEEYSGYSFAEVLFVEQAKGTKDRAAVHFNEAQAVARLQDIQAISQPAMAAMKLAAKGVTPGVRLSGGDEVRAVEARERRQSLHAPSNQGQHYGSLGADSDKKPELLSPPAAEPNNATPAAKASASAADFPTQTPVADDTTCEPDTTTSSATDPDAMTALNDLLEAP